MWLQKKIKNNKASYKSNVPWGIVFSINSQVWRYLPTFLSEILKKPRSVDMVSTYIHAY